MTRVLVVGAPGGLVAGLTGRGYQVTPHDLDVGPAAALVGEPFVPPVTAWPGPDGAFDAVLLLDQLAFVVDDEEAIAEAARVLRPGGMLILRVPSAGLLAWLDPYNAYRYVRDVTGRGPKPHETRGIGWRRHYRRRDLDELLEGQFHVRARETEGVGLAEAARLALLLLFRWLLRREDAYRRATWLPETIWGVEKRLPTGRFGYHLVVVAERLPDGVAGS